MSESCQKATKTLRERKEKVAFEEITHYLLKQHSK